MRLGLGSKVNLTSWVSEEVRLEKGLVGKRNREGRNREARGRKGREKGRKTAKRGHLPMGDTKKVFFENHLVDEGAPSIYLSVVFKTIHYRWRQTFVWPASGRYVIYSKYLWFFWYPFHLIRMYQEQKWSSIHLEFEANESSTKSHSGWAPKTGRSTTVTFSTFVGDEIKMDGRPDPFSSVKKKLLKHANRQKYNNRPPKRLLAGAPDNTQLFWSFKIPKVFITRKIGVPAQGWKTPITYYVRRRAENTANASQRMSPPRVQVTLESLGTHSYAALPNRGDWQAGQTYTRSCAGTQVPLVWIL